MSLKEDDMPPTLGTYLEHFRQTKQMFNATCTTAEQQNKQTQQQGKMERIESMNGWMMWTDLTGWNY